MHNQRELPIHLFSEERRFFIINSLKAAGASFCLTIPGISMASSTYTAAKAFTVQDIIDILMKPVAALNYPTTVDTIKSGDKNQEVTGIVTSMFATVPIIRKAIELKANFIIAHEPAFYNHTDDKKWVEHNETLDQKLALLEKHKIAVWRFHDYIHAYHPDSVTYGVMKQAGWEKYYKENEAFHIPSISLKNLALHLKKSLNIQHLRVIGDLNQSCEKLVLLPGASGGQEQVTMVEKFKPDVLIVGELQEWETAEYIRDSRAVGSNIALIILGHAVSEEPGMTWVQQWLQPKIAPLKITHIPTPDPFTWL
ncbi:MAG: Nif3-like dinuclear metal center hexameric protein [Flavitalea sp.]